MTNSLYRKEKKNGRTFKKRREVIMKEELTETITEEVEEKENQKQEVSYEDIKNANETIKTTSIKGKDYAEVNQRVKAFRMVYPQGKIYTEMQENSLISLPDVKQSYHICTFRAEVYDNKGNLLGTGTAYEKENSTFINQTSYIENCETSAVGRALGFAGFGIDVSIVSFEEVQNAINQQKSVNSDLEEYKKVIDSYFVRKPEQKMAFMEKYAVKKPSDVVSKMGRQELEVLIGDLKNAMSEG